MMMKSEREIVKALTELQLEAHEMEVWDGEPEMYINQGWEEALHWVIGMLKDKRYNSEYKEWKNGT